MEESEKRHGGSHRSRNQGPLRLVKFCALGILLPILALFVPIYMRFVVLRPEYFTMSPSDMKLLNHEGRISTVWCQGQELRLNGTFNAYLLDKRPTLKRHRQYVTMKRNMVLQDDIKEFWGFYLLKGSVVKLAACARHEGASFIVVKGLKDARRCSYLGELDSQEESDEVSQEFEFNQDIAATSKQEIMDPHLQVHQHQHQHQHHHHHHHQKLPETPDVVRGATTHWAPPMMMAPKSNGSRSEEILVHLEAGFRGLSGGSKQLLIQRLLESIGQDPTSEEAFSATKAKAKVRANTAADKVVHLLPQAAAPDQVAEPSLPEAAIAGSREDGKVSTVKDRSRKVKLLAKELSADDGIHDAGGEDLPGEENGDEVYELQRVGNFNQQNPNDKSGEEVRSSWSSSEEELARCEGLIFNVALDGDRNCSPDSDPTGEDDEAGSSSSVTLEVSESGFYYFIFANENEITDNFLRARFDMQKTSFDLGDHLVNCTNVTSCSLPLSFWSEDHVVLEVPEEDDDDDDGDESATPSQAANSSSSSLSSPEFAAPSDLCKEENLIKGFSSYAKCHQVVLAQSVCVPRKPVYLIFVLLVPILVLSFAYV